MPMDPIETIEPISPERHERPGNPEYNREADFEQVIKGAQMLENPGPGGFAAALQSFVAWVRRLADPK